MDSVHFKSIPDSNKLSQDVFKKDPEFNGCVKYRVCTDRHFLVLLVSCLVVVSGLTMYCAMNGDLHLIFNGHDSCGNICGINNEKSSDLNLPCFGKDMTNKKILEIDSLDPSIEQNCVESCNKEGYIELLNRCFPGHLINDSISESRNNAPQNYGRLQDDEFDLYNGREKPTPAPSVQDMEKFLMESVEDLEACSGHMIFLTAFSAVGAFSIIILLRHWAGVVIWTMMCGIVASLVFISLGFWVAFFGASSVPPMSEQENSKSVFMWMAIIFTFITIFVFCIIYVMRKRISLVVRLFKEAGRAVTDMPLLLAVPLLTFSAFVLMSLIFVYFGLQVDASGFPYSSEQMNPKTFVMYKVVSYYQNGVMQFSFFFVLFMWLWMTQFCIGCQHMVIAGSTASWFFTRDKANLRSPIKTAATNLFSFHLGSVALGSLIIAIIQVIRIVFQSIKYSMKYSKSSLVRILYRCIESFFMFVESLLRFLTRNAYIEVAMYGESFCTGGKQAVRLLTSNILRVYAINSVGDFVLFLGKAVVVALTTVFGAVYMPAKHSLFIPLVVLAIIAFLVATSVFSVYEMMIDTVFLCFCEDCEMNDGQSKPYFMSAGLMKFMEEAKKDPRVLKVGDDEAQ